MAIVAVSLLGGPIVSKPFSAIANLLFKSDEWTHSCKSAGESTSGSVGTTGRWPPIQINIASSVEHTWWRPFVALVSMSGNKRGKDADNKRMGRIPMKGFEIGVPPLEYVRKVRSYFPLIIAKMRIWVRIGILACHEPRDDLWCSGRESRPSHLVARS